MISWTDDRSLYCSEMILSALDVIELCEVQAGWRVKELFASKANRKRGDRRERGLLLILYYRHFRV